MGFLWVGILCVLIGLGVLTHTYWSNIPMTIKIILFSLASVLLIFIIYEAVKKNKKHIFETALFISFLMIGGGIGLSAQVFDLPVNSKNGLFVWAILSFFVVLFSKKEFLFLLWIPLFIGGVLGFLKLELLLLFFEQAPLFLTLVLAGFLFLCIWIARNKKPNWIQAIYKWSVLLYIIVVFLGDRATNHPIIGFSLFAFFMLLLLAISVSEQRCLLFNFISLCLVIRLIFLFSQLAENLHLTGITFLSIGVIILLLGGAWLWLEKKLILKNKFE